MAFHEVWERIKENAGEEFNTIGGLPFHYIDVDNNGLTRIKEGCRDTRLNKTHFEWYYEHGPVDGPGIINNDVWGPTYVWGIMHDERIREEGW